MDYDRFLCEISRKRGNNLLRVLSKICAEGPPTQISFGGGLPNATTFPFESMQIKAKNGIEFKLEGKDMMRSLQYGASEGVAELREWFFRIQKKYHDPPLMREDKLGLIVTVGCQDGLSKAFYMLLSPGDNLLVEGLVFPGTLAVIKPMPVNLLGVEIDEKGIKPESLLKILSKWSPEDAKNPKSDIPKVLYTVPNGGNPSGSTATLERKKKIYEIAQLYNLIIIEDDPYYFLQFHKEVAPSYQSMDTDGRVVRGDSLSKVVSAGLRVGWMTAAKPLIDRMFMDQQSNVLHPSSLSQILASKLFDQWGLDGFENHVKSIQLFYQSQRDLMLASANKWLTGLAEWNVPLSGMYLWMRFLTLTDTTEELFRQAMENEVIVVPGQCFTIDGTPSPYCRLSYSCASPTQIEQGIRKLSEVIRPKCNGHHNGTDVSS